MVQQVLHEFLFPGEVPRGRLDRFDPVDVVVLTEEGAVEQALARLCRENLVASLSSPKPLEIVGGRARRDAGGFFVYEDGFIVSVEPDGGFLAGVTGPGNLAEEAQTKTLPEAIDFIIDVFRHRARRSR